MGKNILDVGQCMVDGPRMGRMLKERFHATVDRASSLDEAVKKAGEKPYDLVLVNRLLANDSSPGLAVVDALVGAGSVKKIMLVSDMDDAQDEAVEHGAIRGFGKAELDSPSTEALITEALSD